jgi:hypothetical protein
MQQKDVLCAPLPDTLLGAMTCRDAFKGLYLQHVWRMEIPRKKHLSKIEHT